MDVCTWSITSSSGNLRRQLLGKQRGVTDYISAQPVFSNHLICDNVVKGPVYPKQTLPHQGVMTRVRYQMHQESKSGSNITWWKKKTAKRCGVDNIDVIHWKWSEKTHKRQVWGDDFNIRISKAVFTNQYNYFSASCLCVCVCVCLI